MPTSIFNPNNSRFVIQTHAHQWMNDSPFLSTNAHVHFMMAERSNRKQNRTTMKGANQSDKILWDFIIAMLKLYQKCEWIVKDLNDALCNLDTFYLILFFSSLFWFWVSDTGVLYTNQYAALKSNVKWNKFEDKTLGTRHIRHRTLFELENSFSQHPFISQ